MAQARNLKQARRINVLLNVLASFSVLVSGAFWSQCRVSFFAQVPEATPTTTLGLALAILVQYGVLCQMRARAVPAFKLSGMLDHPPL
jgi:hypothetical protein